MILSDTTNKSGLIQECEFWTNLGDGTISGDVTLMKVFVNRLNRARDSVMPLIMDLSDTMRWDDSNHPKQPIGFFDIQEGVNDYELLTDEQGNSILNIVAISILDSASSTEYRTLLKMTLDEPRALRAMSPNPSDIGVPSAFVERNNTVFFDVMPTYDATAGGKVFFERSYLPFSADALSQTSGLPEIFDKLVAKESSHDWLLVNKAEATTLITRVEAAIAQDRKDISDLIAKKHPTRRRATGRRSPSI